MALGKIFDLVFRVKGTDKAKREVGQVDDKISGLGSTAASAARLIGPAVFGGALIGIGTNAVRTAAQFESLRVRLNALTGSVDKGGQLFDKFNTIAATTPFQLDRVVEAGASLEAFGADSEKTLKGVTDLAAFMGVDVVDAAAAFGRAFAGGAGAADVLRDRGVLTLIKLKTGVDDLTKLSLPEFRAALQESIENPSFGIAGATDLLSQTFDGAYSNMQDSVAQLANAFGQRLLPSSKDVVLSIKETADSLRSFIEVPTSEKTREQSTEFNTLIEVLKDVNVEETTRKRIIEDLNKNFPKLIGNIDLQSASTEDLVSLQRQSNEQFEKQIRLQVANEILADQLKEIAQAEKELIELRLSSANSFEILRQGSGKNVQENDRLNQKIEEQKEKLESLRDVYKETNGQLLQQGILVTENNEGQTIAIEQTGALSKTFEELKPRLISEEDAENLFVFQGELEQAGIKAEESSQKIKGSSAAIAEQINLSNALASSLQTAFDPDLGAGEAFKGFILQLMSALQGVILSSKAVSEALTFTFVPGIGIGVAVAALAALEAAKAGVRSIKFAQYGMDEMVSQPTLIVAGEAGPERVQVTPSERPAAQQQGALTINFNGPVTSSEFVRDTIIPEIEKVQRLGLA
tara:strand:+ start:2753 stop:4657 length:1905 start_codon:yes stop_codon:yes gene_type:complete